jgi:hypothetical protein
MLFVKSAKLRRVLAGSILLINIIGSYGLLYAPMTDNDHVQLERSLEYRNDYAVNLKFIQSLEKKYRGYEIAAPFTLAQMIEFPELGYVKEKFNTMIYGFRCTYGDIKDYPGMAGINISRTVFVGVNVQHHLPFAYPLNPQDQLLETLQAGDKKAYLFMGGVGIEKMRKLSEARTLQRLKNHLK